MSGYARVSVSSKAGRDGALLVLRFAWKQWAVIAGPGTSDVGCTEVPSRKIRVALRLGCLQDGQKPRAPTGDRWVLARDVETAFYENGVSGVKVTLVSCDGVGRAGPRINDEYGSPTTTYRIFTCYAIPSGQSTKIYRVDITSGSRAAGFRYSYLES